MNLTYLREFLVFQEHMNYTAAAKELFISQPALSNHIAALEDSLGVKLVRHGQQLFLTQAARFLVANAPALLQHHDQVASQCKEIYETGGTITIAREHGTYSCGADNLDMLLSLFIEEHPNVFFRDISWDDANAFNVLACGQADIVSMNYCVSKFDTDKHVAYMKTPNFADGKFALWVDKSHPLARKEHVTWADVSFIKSPVSSEHRLNGSNVENLCAALGIEFVGRKSVDFGWGFMHAMQPDEMLVLDSGFMDYRPLDMFASRKLVPIEGENSECALYLAYLPENDNRALKVFLDFANAKREELEIARRSTGTAADARPAAASSA